MSKDLVRNIKDQGEFKDQEVKIPKENGNLNEGIENAEMNIEGGEEEEESILFGIIVL